MTWTPILNTVDVHCAGEVGRVIVDAVEIPGNTLAEKLTHINEVDDSLRRWLCSEPRSSANQSFVLLQPACHPDADFGMIVLQADQAHAMSGSNAMCAVTAILESGMMKMTEPETIVTLDTAAGLVPAVAHCLAGKVTSVSLMMPPSFVAMSNASISTLKWGKITYDLCFGGVFYALVNVEQIGLTISPNNARDLADKGVELRDLIVSQTNIAHPDFPEINGIAYVMFRSLDNDGAIRTCTTLKPARVDRSPCGTGSNSTVAVKHFQGSMRVGDKITTRSIIGGEFTAELLGAETIGPYNGSRVQVTGQCWIYAKSQIGQDPTDPYPSGFILSDTWGG
jgi:proline racemase